MLTSIPASGEEGLLKDLIQRLHVTQVKWKLHWWHTHLSVRSGSQVIKCSNTTPLCLNQNSKGLERNLGLQFKQQSKYSTSGKVSELRSLPEPGQNTAGFDKAPTFNSLLRTVDRTGIILPLSKTAFPNSQFYQPQSPLQISPAGDSGPWQAPLASLETTSAGLRTVTSLRLTDPYKESRVSSLFHFPLPPGSSSGESGKQNCNLWASFNTPDISSQILLISPPWNLLFKELLPQPPVFFRQTSQGNVRKFSQQNKETVFTPF